MLLVRINRRDGFDVAIGLVPKLMRAGHDLMAATENGQVRWYAASIGIGAVLVLAAAFLVP